MVAKKHQWLVGGLFVVGYIIALAIRSYWMDFRQIHSESNVLIFRTGTGSVLLWLFLGLAGLAAVFWYRFARSMLEQSTSFWKSHARFLIVFTGLLIAVSGIAYFSHGREITVNIDSKVVNVRNQYFFGAPVVEQIPFRNITSVKYGKTVITSGTVMHYGYVKLRLVGGKEIYLSSNGPENQYRLAKRISKALEKPLIERGK